MTSTRPQWLLAALLTACGADRGMQPDDSASVDMTATTDDLAVSVSDLGTSDLASDDLAVGGFDMATSNSDFSQNLPDASAPLLTWSTSNVTTQPLFAVGGSSPTDVYAGGMSGAFFHSSDHGGSWQPITAPSVDIMAVWAYDSTHAIAGGTGGTILVKASSGGFTTAKVGSGAYLGVWGSSNSDAWVVGEGGKILHSTNGGTSWTDLSASGVTVQLRGVWGTGPLDVYVCGDAGTMLHSTNGGTSWTSLTTNTSQLLWSVWGDGTGLMYTGGNSNTFLRSLNSGTSWTTIAVTGGAGAVESISGAGGRVYAAHAQGPGAGEVLATLAGSDKWQANKTSSAYLVSIWAAGATEVYAVGETGTVLVGR